MIERRRNRRQRPAVDNLEERSLMAVAAVPAPAATTPVVVAASGGKVHMAAYDPAGFKAIMDAINGGPGNEFVRLITNQIGFTGALNVVNGFQSGRLTHYELNGFGVKNPAWNPVYNGTKFDHLTATAAGAIVWTGAKKLELGVILRGPLDENASSVYVFPIDRGTGTTNPLLPAKQAFVKYDALVIVKVGPYGKNATATVVDRATGKSTAIPTANILVNGAVIRVYVDLKALPQKKTTVPPTLYKFGLWTQDKLGTASNPYDIKRIGSFVPETTMLRVGTMA